MLKFTTKELQRLRFVCRTGGNNPQVKWNVSGIESVVNWNLITGKLQLSKKGVVHVFDNETNKYLGYIKKDENDIPRSYPEQNDLYFKDFYTEVEGE